MILEPKNGSVVVYVLKSAFESIAFPDREQFIEKAGKIWYDTLCNRLRPNSNFKAAANATLASANDLLGYSSTERSAVKAAWKQVGVL